FPDLQKNIVRDEVGPVFDDALDGSEGPGGPGHTALHLFEHAVLRDANDDPVVVEVAVGAGEMRGVDVSVGEEWAIEVAVQEGSLSGAASADHHENVAAQEEIEGSVVWIEEMRGNLMILDEVGVSRAERIVRIKHRGDSGAKAVVHRYVPPCAERSSTLVDANVRVPDDESV